MAYTTIDDPSAHFHTQLYTGNRSSSQTITNDGNSDLKPDWLWIKPRNDTVLHSHSLFDSTRGVTKGLASNLDEAEYTTSSKVTSFNTDGFSIGNGASVNQPDRDVNYVTWQWKANGGTTSSNSDGSITATVQANTTAGFSIVTYTGTGANATIGHGLGVVPDWILVKNRTDNGSDWCVYHAGNTSAPETDFLKLNTTEATEDVNSIWNDTAPTSSVFTVGTSNGTNGSGDSYVAYCFAPIKGYSKFAKYTGNGSAVGPFVLTGFLFFFIMYKNISRSTAGAIWWMWDTTRDTRNPTDLYLRANDTTAEGSFDSLDILSNGFKLRTSDGGQNASGETIVYMAFAEHPFVSSKGVPVTAR